MRHFLGDFFSPPQTRAVLFHWLDSDGLVNNKLYFQPKGKIWTEISLKASSLAQNTGPFVNSPLVELRLCPRLQSKTPSLSSAPLLMPLTTSTTASSSPSLENIFYHYNDPDSDSGIVYFGMWVLHPFYPLFAHLFTEKNSSILPTSNLPFSPALSATSTNTGDGHLSHRSNHFHMHIASRADNPTTLTQQNADSKTEFQSPYWNLVSDQAKSFVRRIIVLDYFHHPTA